MEENNNVKPFPVALPHQDPVAWKKICSILQEKINNPRRLEQAIMELTEREGEPCWLFWKNNYSIMELEHVARFWNTVMPFIQSLVLSLPETFPNPIYHLVTNQEDTVVLSRKQVACLIACGFFGIFTVKKHFPSLPMHVFNRNCLNIINLFGLDSGQMAEFGHCIVNYFSVISNIMPTGNIRIHRKCLQQPPNFAESTKPLCKISITQDPIESHVQHSFHADFANMFIGGGVLNGGSVQEEILFVIKPECLVSMLICSKIEPHEAIVITGAEQFSKYKGYGTSFNFAGAHNDITPRDKGFDCLKNHIVVVDATTNFRHQFTESIQLRDLRKLYVGLKDGHLEESEPGELVYVTGNWGCGAFGGDKQLKAVQQIVAVSEAGMDLVYSTFKDQTFSNDFTKFVDFLQQHHLTVGQLFTALPFSKQETNVSIYSFDVVRQNLLGATVGDKMGHDVDTAGKENDKMEIVEEDGYGGMENVKEDKNKIVHKDWREENVRTRNTVSGNDRKVNYNLSGVEERELENTVYPLQHKKTPKSMEICKKENSKDKSPVQTNQNYWIVVVGIFVISVLFMSLRSNSVTE